jgi:hypothetical protein
LFVQVGEEVSTGQEYNFLHGKYFVIIWTVMYRDFLELSIIRANTGCQWHRQRKLDHLNWHLSIYSKCRTTQYTAWCHDECCIFETKQWKQILIFSICDLGNNVVLLDYFHICPHSKIECNLLNFYYMLCYSPELVPWSLAPKIMSTICDCLFIILIV